MKRPTDYSDERERVTCTHCGVFLDPRDANEDHVPSKCLLDRPLPDDPPSVVVCAPCNSSFARDEEYLFVFLAAVLTGDPDPDPDRFPSAARAVRRSVGLRERIRRAQIHQLSLLGETETIWYPELERINRVIVKNARGHALHEFGETVAGPPSRVACCPVSRMTVEQQDTFERTSIGGFAGWPAVGSRSMQRLAGVAPGANGWIEVQEGVYRYAVLEEPTELVVRSVIREYLATEVAWDFDQIS